ncbi:hypothetical protein RF11_01852 [Thelohanellus kitauei]|uniref:Uncharacterized protein n=1 Tax=Thelohanellus kitauei TaxID=669202 RepID=A0A0C2MFH6_THEKT|nr:hypothetical protein RF11_01852 [Thelohanellus kitauei]
MMIEVIKCINGGQSDSFCDTLPTSFQVVPNCLTKLNEPEIKMTQDEAKGLYDSFKLRISSSQRNPAKGAPLVHDYVVNSLTTYLEQYKDFDDIFKLKWPEILESMPRIYLMTNCDFLIRYCYIYKIASSSSAISNCASSTLFNHLDMSVAIKKLVGLPSTTGTNSSENTKIKDDISKERIKIVDKLIKACEEARGGGIGDIFPLVLSEVKSRLNEPDEVNKAVVEFVEEAQKLIKDDCDKKIQPTSAARLSQLEDDKVSNLIKSKEVAAVSNEAS